LFILGLPLVGTYVYLEKMLFANPLGFAPAPAGPLSSHPSASARRLESGLSASAFAVSIIVACISAVLLGLRILFETGDAALLGSKWADFYEVLLGPSKILFVLGVFLAVTALVKGWPHRNLSRASLVLYGLVFWAYVGIMWWQQLRPSEVMGIAIVEYGLFEVSGDGGLSSDYVCVQTTDSVEARLGACFGVKYIVLGRPAGGKAQCNVLWKFPQPGVWDSVSGAYHMSLVRLTTEAIGDPSPSVYRFHTRYDLLPGEWVVQLRDQYGDIDERHFFVQKTEEADSSAASKVSLLTN
jgi:hypothetical protein